MTWVGNIVANGDANNGTSSWDATNVTVETIGIKKYFRLQNGRMKQSIDVEKWIIGVHQVRLSFVARVNESVTDKQVQSVARIKFTLEDGRVETAYRLIESADFETFEVIHDINKRKVTQIEIEIRGADLLVTDIACEKAFGVDEETADYVKSQMPVYLYAVNNAALTIGDIQQYPLHVILTHEEPTNLHVGLMIVGQASAALTLQVKFLLGGGRLNFELNQICADGWNTISANFLIPQLQPGSRRFEVQVQTDVGTFTVQPEHMQLLVMGANLEGGISPDAPWVNWEEFFKVSKVVPRVGDIEIGQRNPLPSSTAQTVRKPRISTSVTIQFD